MSRGLSGSSPRATEPDVAAGRYPVAHWVFEGLGHEGQPWPRSEAVVLILSNLREPPRHAPHVVSDLAALLEHVDVRMLPVEPPRDFVRLVAELP